MSTQNSNYFRVANWLRMAGKQPNGITMSTQIGCSLEEMTEFFDSLTLASTSGAASVLLSEASRLLKEVADQLKAGDAFAYIYDRKEALDAMCDIDVTINGVAYLGGFMKEEADTLIIDSLYDKFMPDGSPVILPGGKIGKRPGWVAPDITPFIGELTMPPESAQPFNHSMEAEAWAREFHRKNPTADVEDSALVPLIKNALLYGMEYQRGLATSEAEETPAGVQSLVSDLNASTEASSNSIAPTGDSQN